MISIKFLFVSRFCPVCNKEIKIKPSNIFYELLAEDILDIKIDNHCREEHDTRYYTTTGIAKKLINISVILCICILLIPLYFVTFPFYRIHTMIFGGNRC